MVLQKVNDIFTEDVLSQILPPQRSDEFFTALYGDPDEGAYDIKLVFKNYDNDGKVLSFELQLHERPDKCLACNLTYGLPEVFSRHPLINIRGMVQKITALLGEATHCEGWELGNTQTLSDRLHVIPLLIRVTEAG
jgi:hypothetical protein